MKTSASRKVLSRASSQPSIVWALSARCPSCRLSTKGQSIPKHLAAIIAKTQLDHSRYGRRWAIFVGSAIMIVGAIIQGFAQHVGMYIAARWLLGFGIPFCIVAGSSLLGELGYPKERPILTSLFNSSYFVGASKCSKLLPVGYCITTQTDPSRSLVVAAGITYGTTSLQTDWSWRIPSLLQAVPSLLQVGLIFFIPESPRFLISKDRRDEAFAILTKYHAEGDATSALVQAEMAQIETTVKLEMELAKKSWLDLFASKGMRRRLLVGSLLGLFTQWSGNTLISYVSPCIHIGRFLPADITAHDIST